MSESISRRGLLKIAAGTAAAGAGTAALSGCSTIESMMGSDEGGSSDAFSIVSGKASLPAAKGPRVVVVGGGWSGLTMAKYLKRYYDKLDIVLVEKNSLFMSCPISNIWLAGAVDTDFLLHSYDDAAKNNGYIFFNATVINADRENRVVYTDQGSIDYDYLIVAPGIDYNYASIGVNPEQEFMLRKKFPAGFMPGSEHLTLKGKLEDFEGGVFIQTVPKGNYRCLPGPYERTCLIAEYMKREKIKGKVILLDQNPDITIKAEGFHHAFDNLYKDYVQYIPGVNITGVDPEKQQVIAETDGFKDTYDFADAAIYPSVRGAKLIEIMGLTKEGSQMEADIDPFTYQAKGDEHVYVTGDARPMGYSKSGNTSNSEAHYVAKVVAYHAQGKELPTWESPQTICFSAVKTEPLESIMVDAKYKYDGRTLAGFTDVTLKEKWTPAMGQGNIAWAEGMFNDMFR
ncbi:MULTISPECIES: NAD(P)/FAD-dependent oxidoreductase [Thiomicrorhabdus]|uniref:NAD(P)/FAD-dependent oxidoreductase n=1 Tax=Thiomicrorhabdus heinhorstiae TaxID=2748010 RepID=A0ABS0BWU6_9GAMM|nr:MULTISPECIES: FAD/NAD(P)-binding oxidoreductase [Thiomicrorhabdus]MBF6058240.1 NAD(P)/FAD-dependent oxidoreductase [Thiomicrorhabdus heinhorstiae]